MHLKKNLTQVKDYVGTAEIQFFVNVKKFNVEKNGPKSIDEYSIPMHKYFSADVPTYATVEISPGSLYDKTDYLQLGQTYIRNFFDVKMTEYGLSYMHDYPDFYAFLDISFTINEDLLMMERSTYSFLDCIGDVGGLSEFLYILLGLTAAKFSKLKMNAELVSSLNVVADKKLITVAEKILSTTHDKV